MCIAKTKALISCSVTAQLICVSLFLHIQIIGFLTQRLIHVCKLLDIQVVLRIFCAINSVFMAEFWFQ